MHYKHAYDGYDDDDDDDVPMTCLWGYRDYCQFVC